MITTTPEERIFKDLVKYPTNYKYIEIGPDFFKIRDNVTGKMYLLKISELKEKIKEL